MKIIITDNIEACLALRRAVFIEEQSVPEAEEMDGRDAEAIHLLALDHDKPVGCARILLKNETGKIGRVCVLPSHRGTGMGAALINAALDHLRSLPGVTRATLGAQTQARVFYEKLGFTAHGPEFEDAGIAHRQMSRPV